MKDTEKIVKISEGVDFKYDDNIRHMIKILPDKAILGQIAEIERLREQCGAVKLPVSITLTLRKNSRKRKDGGPEVSCW